MKPIIIPETPEFQRSKRLSTLQSSAATLSLVNQQSSTSKIIQDTPDSDNAHRIFMEKKLKYSRRKDISTIPSEETFVAQSQDILSSTIVPSSSPLLARKLKEQPPIPPASLVTTSSSNSVGYLNTEKVQEPSTPTKSQDPGPSTTSGGSSSRRKKGKPCKIVAWDKLESVDPLATSVFRTNNVRLEITEPVNKNINDKPKDAPPPKPVSTRLQAVENVEKQEKVEKKPKRRESVSRRRMSNMNPESFVNFILAKEKTPSPSTRLMKERLAASFAEDSSDEECLDTPDKVNIDAKKETAQKQDKEDGASRKSIFISGNLKSRVKQQLQSGGSLGVKPIEENNKPVEKQSKTRKNLSKELGPEPGSSNDSSLLAVPIFYTNKQNNQQKRGGRRSLAVQPLSSRNASTASLNKTSSATSIEGSSISVSGIEGLSFQNFSSDSAKAALTRLEKEGWNSDIEKQLTGQKKTTNEVSNDNRKNDANANNCDNSTSSKKSLKRKISTEEPEKSTKKGKFGITDDNNKAPVDEICPTPKTTKPIARIRNEQKTSFTPEPMDLCDSPARRSGRKSTQASTLATEGLLKSPALLKQSKVANDPALPPTKSAKTSSSSKIVTSKAVPSSSSDKAVSSRPIASGSQQQPEVQSVINDASNQNKQGDSEEDIPATQAPPLFENLVFYVEIMNGRYNISSYSESRIKQYGGTVVQKISKKVTHILFHDGTRVNYLKAKKLGVPILSSVYADRCIEAGKLLSPSEHPSVNIEDYDKGKFPSIRKLKSMTIRSTEERMKIIDEKFKKKQRKLEKEKEKEEAKKRELREAAKARPKPIYFPPLYYEGSPYVKPEKKEDKLSKLMDAIKSPTGSPIRMEYFKAPSTPVWEDENEINLSLADRLLYRYKKNKALERGNTSGASPTLHNNSLTETPPANKIFESSSLDTTGKPRRLHPQPEESTIQETPDKSINLSTNKTSTKKSGRQKRGNNTTTNISTMPVVVENEDGTANEIDESLLSGKRRSGRASTQLATKVSGILAKQEASPLKLSVSPSRISGSSSKSNKKCGESEKEKSSEKPSENINTTKTNVLENSKLKKKRGRKPKNFDAEILKANGDFGAPVLESTRLSVMDSTITQPNDNIEKQKPQEPNKSTLNITKQRVIYKNDKPVITNGKAQVKIDNSVKPVNKTMPQASNGTEEESPIVSQGMTSKLNQSRMLNSTNQPSPNNSASKDENDRLFDALISGKKPPSTNTDSAKKKFILADKNSKTQKPTKEAESAKVAKAVAAVASNLSPRQTNSSPRASPRHYGSSATCPSPSASPRQDSGSSPRHHQSSAPRPVSKSVDLLGGKQWEGSKPGKPVSGSGPASLLSPSAASIYQYSLGRSRIPSKTPVEQETSPTNTTSPQSKQPQETCSTSSPDSLTGTPVSGRKPKVMAPWRQNKDTSPAQNVSKDNVYDFDGDPDEFDVSMVTSTQSITSAKPSVSGESSHVGKMFRISPSKPQGTFLLRSKLTVPPAGKMNLNSVLKSHHNPSAKPTVHENSNTSLHQVPKPTTTNSTVQPSHSREKPQPNNNKDHQQPPVSHSQEHEQQQPSSSTTYHPSLSESTASSHLSSIEPMAESTRNNIEKDYGTDYAMSMQEPDRPQRSAKKALLSRIFSKPPKETEDFQSSSGSKETKETTATKPGPETCQELSQRTESSDIIRPHRKRKLYSQDVLDETARNSPTTAHKGITEAPKVENVHVPSSHSSNSQQTSKSSKGSSAASKSSSLSNEAATSEFKAPPAATKKKKGKKKNNDNTEENEDEDNDTHKLSHHKKKGTSKSRRSSAEFAPLPKFIRRMEEREASNSSDSSKRRRGATKNIVCTSCTQEDISLVHQLVQSYGKYTVSTTVNARTSHVISGEGKRTLNLLKGLLSGCWLVTREWVLSSLEAGQWVDEEPYEMVDFSQAVRTLRMERETWRETFKSELFKEVGAIYISPNCRAPRDELKQLVHAGGGLVTGQARMAKVRVGGSGASSASSNHESDDEETFTVTEKWILDSVQFHMVLPFSEYPVR